MRKVQYSNFHFAKYRVKYVYAIFAKFIVDTSRIFETKGDFLLLILLYNLTPILGSDPTLGKSPFIHTLKVFLKDAEWFFNKINFNHPHATLQERESYQMMYKYPFF